MLSSTSTAPSSEVVDVCSIIVVKCMTVQPPGILGATFTDSSIRTPWMALVCFLEIEFGGIMRTWRCCCGLAAALWSNCIGLPVTILILRNTRLVILDDAVAVGYCIDSSGTTMWVQEIRLDVFAHAMGGNDSSLPSSVSSSDKCIPQAWYVSSLLFRCNTSAVGARRSK